MRTWVRRFIGAAKALCRPGRADGELDAELQDFFERAVEDRVARGMSYESARRAARMALGPPAVVREKIRDVGWESIVDSIRQDVRYAARSLRKSPGFTAVAILTLAFGIGGSTAIFTLVDAILLDSLPVRDPESLVAVRAGGLYPVFRAFQKHTEIFTDLCATSGVTPLDVDAPDGSRERANVSLVSATYFSTLGVSAARGRVFAFDEDAPAGQHPVAVVSDAYWRRRFAREPGILDRIIRINATSIEIVGVAPAGFFGERLGASPDLWIPLSMWGRIVPGRNLFESPGTAWLQMLGRVRPGVRFSGLQPALTHTFQNVVTEIFGPQAPDDVRRDVARATVRLEPAGKGLSDVRVRLQRPLQLLMGAVLLVLLIGCANIANLLLARSRARGHEIDLRLALGVSRARLVRQLLMESLLLAIVGALLGMAVAWVSREPLLVLISNEGSALAIEPAIDARVLVFVVALSSATVILFGLVPAWHTTRTRMITSLVARRDAGGDSGRRLNALLVVAQIALSLILLTGGGLFLRTLTNLRDVDLGFAPERLLVLDIGLQARGRGDELPPALVRRLRHSLQALPGVSSVSFSENGVLAGRDNGSNIMRPEGSIAGAEGFPRTRWDVVGPGYFRTLGTRLVAGRDFTEHDDAGSPAVIAVNEAMARRLFGSNDALGRRLQWGGGAATPLQIVAIVGDVKVGGPREDTQLRFYIPYLQLATIRPNWILASLRLLIRTIPDPAIVVPSLRGLVASDARVSGAQIETGSDLVSRTIARERSVATLLGIFSILAVGLASVGVYGLINYQVLRRRNEIGLRMALGSTRGRVMWTMLSPALAWTSIGIVAGIPMALLAGRAARSLLFGLTATNAGILATSAAVMFVIGLLAAYLPARRASRIDPLAALRCD